MYKPCVTIYIAPKEARGSGCIAAIFVVEAGLFDVFLNVSKVAGDGFIDKVDQILR